MAVIAPCRPKIVGIVCEENSVECDALLAACKAYASAQCSIGVKTVEHIEYKAGLKIMAISGEWIYADAAAVGNCSRGWQTGLR